MLLFCKCIVAHLYLHNSLHTINNLKPITRVENYLETCNGDNVIRLMAFIFRCKQLHITLLSALTQFNFINEVTLSVPHKNYLLVTFTLFFNTSHFHPYV